MSEKNKGLPICLKIKRIWLFLLFYIGEKFSGVINNAPVSVFIIGVEKLSNDFNVLNKAKVSFDARARSIIFGRNIFISENP